MNFFKQNEQLERIGKDILETIWVKFPELGKNQIAVTWIVYDHSLVVNTDGSLSPEAFWSYPLRSFSYRGNELIYPASIVKLFYLVAIHEWLMTGKVTRSKELERAIHDMIADSSNDATSLVVDVLTGTTSGPQLSSGPFETWKYQRNIVNRYFQSLGWPELKKINVNQKTWCDGPYGRERDFVGELLDNRNMLTTNAVAKLLHSIIGGVAISRESSLQMMSLLQRSLDRQDLKQSEDENQILGFLGESLPQNAQIWSKAGWTSKVRHDVAYIEIPDLQPYLLVVFTEGKVAANSRQIIPNVSSTIVEAMKTI